MPGPSVSHWTCAVPKAGSSEDDYEDASALVSETWPVCAAVADGATESVFAGDWATRLVRGVVETEATTADAFATALPDWRDEWRRGLPSRAAERPWYVSAKVEEGAFATVLGLSLHADGGWRAVSVGDCCLFHVRGGEVVESWPYDAAEAFTNRPDLVSSRPAQAVPAPRTATGTWRPADRFVLATDAVAAWLLETAPSSLRDLSEKSARSRIATARTDGDLRNDDVTLLVLNLLPPADAATGTAHEA
jgi:hypothetical protein